MGHAQSNNPDQESKLPYAVKIPDYPKKYTAGTVASRLVDGLGFRYFWATEGLRNVDLTFKPSEEARTTRQTLDHIYDLVVILKNAVSAKINDGSQDPSSLKYHELRKSTLQYIEQASKILRNSTDEQVTSYLIKFQRKQGNIAEYPFWNMINGPIADALWHVGQVISFRRSSGNPYNSKASMFQGKIRN